MAEDARVGGDLVPFDIKLQPRVRIRKAPRHAHVHHLVLLLVVVVVVVVVLQEREREKSLFVELPAPTPNSPNSPKQKQKLRNGAKAWPTWLFHVPSLLLQNQTYSDNSTSYTLVYSRNYLADKYFCSQLRTRILLNTTIILK